MEKVTTVPLGEYILFEQKMKEKGGRIIRNAAKSEDEKFDYSFTVVAKGHKCDTPIEIGDSPIFSKHVSFNGVKLVEKKKNGMITHVLVHQGDVIGIDKEPFVVTFEEDEAPKEEVPQILMP